MAAIAGMSIPTTKVMAKASISYPSNPHHRPINTTPWTKIKCTTQQLRMMRIRASPDQLSEKVEESIKNAQEACSDDPVSGECRAAWDEVEELSAAASHARDKNKGSDPLENYCEDNPETDECRTYDN